MITLEKYLRKQDQNMLLKSYHIDDIDKWLFETYDEVYESLANDTSLPIDYENQFYNSKYNFEMIDSPKYWFWQDKLYERLDTSVTIDSSIFAKLFKDIIGIDKVIIQNQWCIGFETNDKFSATSKEFERLLDFSNYFIKSKRDSNGELPNPFYIEARKPKELMDYRYKKAWHVTNKYAYEKIQNFGLIPKSKSQLAEYDQRIYLFVDEELSKHDMVFYGNIALRLLDMSISGNDKHDLHDKIDPIYDIVILEIDLEAFEKDHGKQIKLFGDPSYNISSAVFTLEPIQTKYIRKTNINEINTNNKVATRDTKEKIKVLENI